MSQQQQQQQPVIRQSSQKLSSQQHGRLELIIGPMFAGKTSELMRRVKREIHARNSCFIVKYANDVRYNAEHISNHDQQLLRATASASRLSELKGAWKKYDCIAVDEGQFFPDLVEFCREAADAGKIVFVSALDGDFLRRPFGRVCELIPLCEDVTKLTAVCMMCHDNDASFSRRTVASNQQELIGGAEMYIATCRSCYNCPEAPTPRKVGRVRDAIKEVESAIMMRQPLEAITNAAAAKGGDKDCAPDCKKEESPSATVPEANVCAKKHRTEAKA